MTAFHPRRRAGITVLAGVLLAVSFLSAGQRPGPSYRLTQNPVSSNLAWIVEGPGNQNALAAIQQLDPALAAAFFDNSRSTVLAGDSMPSQPPQNEVPPGWPDIPSQHYTSYGPCTSNKGCASLSADIASGALAASGVPEVMYDDENWAKTPDGEKTGVCTAMKQFTQLAHSNQLKTIMAPDQNLASPGVITSFQGGESEDWQTYLRLGLGSCAAASGTDRYHIMSQPFQTQWCGGQGSACEGGEADFADFVTQAALQARAVNPAVTLDAGLSTNPRYNVTPQALFQDTINVGDVVHGFWLNVAGNPSNPATAVQYLEMLNGAVPLYLGGNGTLGETFPAGTAVGKIPLAGKDLSFVSGRDVPAGTVIPAGTYKFEPWTDGSGGSASLDVEVGYCDAATCTHRTPIIPAGSWTPTVPAGDPGVTSSFTTQAPTTLPAGGPYRIYQSVHMTSGEPMDLLYGTGSMSTNMAIPRPSSEPAVADRSVLFAGRGNLSGTALPAPGQAAMLDLGRPGATATFWSPSALPAGQAIPAGPWQFQYWTDGSSGSATVNLQVGYCSAGCTRRTPISGATGQPTIPAGARGAADPRGAFTTTTPAQLPGTGGPYHLYWTLTVGTPGPFHLLYDSRGAPTNLATPAVQPVEAH